MTEQDEQNIPLRNESPSNDVDDVPEEIAVDQQFVPFFGDDLAAALTEAGAIYIALPGMCKALHLHLKGQMQRIKRTRALARGLRRIPLKTQGGTQRINCLRVDRVALWLGGIETDRLNDQFRAKIEAYQEELAPVATEVFLRVVGRGARDLVPMNASPEAHALAEQIETLTGVTNLLREHLAGLLTLPDKVDTINTQLQQAINFLGMLAGHQQEQDEQIAQIDERTQRLTPAHTRAVKDRIDEMVRRTSRLPIPLTYSMIYGRLKRRFRVATYKEIVDDSFAEVMTYLHEELHRALDGVTPEQSTFF